MQTMDRSRSTPVVSILTACYNAAPFLRASVGSILAQTRSDIELVIVDDGSTDGSWDVLSALSDSRLQLIRQENAGASKARNRAFAASSGRFVCFFDADDIMAPRHIESLLARLQTEPHCMALSPWMRFTGTPLGRSFPRRVTEQDMPGTDWTIIDWNLARPMTQSGLFLIPRDLVAREGGWDERLSLIDDFEFFARIIPRSGGVRFAPEAGLYYRSGLTGSLSGQKSRRAVESAFLSLMLGTSHLLAAEDSARTRRVCANILQDFDYTYYPDHADLRAQTRERVKALGGADLAPDGPPGFQKLRRLTGWKVARRIQRLAEQLGWNTAARARTA